MTDVKLPKMEEVFTSSAFLGWNGNFFESMPEGTATSTSGSATATHDRSEGLNIDAGGTVGDAASIEGTSFSFDSHVEAKIFAAGSIHLREYTQGDGHTAAVGIVSNDINDGAAIDLETQEVVVNSTRQSISFDIGNLLTFIIISNRNESETTFHLRGANGTETITLSKNVVNTNTSTYARVVSGGNDTSEICVAAGAQGMML